MKTEFSLPARSKVGGKLNPAWSATNIEARPALAHTNKIKHALGVRRHGDTLEMKALDLPGARLNWITAGESRLGRCDPVTAYLVQLKSPV